MKPPCDKPTLLEIDGGAIKLYRGLPMRLKLARRIGFCKAGAIVGLLAEEARARTERVEGQGKEMTRRRLMGGAAAAGAGAVIFGIAAPARASASEETSIGRLSAVDAERLRSTDAAAQALRVWGEGGTETIHTFTGSDGERIAVLNHEESATSTYVDMASPDIAVTVELDIERQALRYYRSGGTPLAELTRVDGQVQAVELGPAYAPATAEDIAPLWSTTCFLACIGGGVDAGCLADCIGCAASGSPISVDCALCGFCAGALVVLSWEVVNASVAEPG